MVFDLALVTFMDSQGLHALLRASKALRGIGGDVRLRAPSPTVRRLLTLSGVDGRLPIDS